MLGGYKLATERGVAQLPTVGGRTASKKPEREEFLPRTEGCRITKATARLGAEYLRRYRTNTPCAGEGGAVCLGAPKVVTIMGAPQEECAAEKAGQVDASASPAVDYLFEPEPKQLLDMLLPLHVAVQVQRALLESSAAEHAARMQSMDSATRNAKDMVDRLTLYMNKVRQAQITREIIEVVSGAQAT